MSAAWVLGTLLFSTALAGAAHAAESALPARPGRPALVARRQVWTLAVLVSMALPAGSLAAGGVWPGAALRGVAARASALLKPAAQETEVAAVGAAAVDLDALPGPGATAALTPSPLATLRTRTADGAAAAMAVFPVAWLLVSLALLLGYGVFWLHLLDAAAAWRRARLCGRQVLVAPALGPAVFGMRRPAIVLPEWVLTRAPAVQRLVLLHELQHARARDHVLLAVAPLAVVLMPWNLPLWWQLRRLRLAVELDCDDRVLARRVAVREYGILLIELAGRSAPVPAPLAALAGERTVLERRILAMTSPMPRPSRVRSAVLSTAAGVLVLAGVLAFGLVMPVAGAANAGQDAVAADARPIVGPLATSAEAGIDASATSSSEATSSAAASSSATQAAVPSAQAARAAPIGVPVRPMAADTPIIVVDGVIVGPVQLERALDGVRVVGVEVLKGAAAVALFGERGRNGAILITTPATAQPGQADEAEVARVRAVEAQIAAARAGPQPLVIVDGVIVGSYGDVPSLADTLDIESIEIVKGPAASRLYGTRAAGGVIAITTKKKQE